MNINDLPTQDRTIAIEAEQSVLGALLLDNDSIDRIGDLRVEHFYRAEHRAIYAEVAKQVAGGKTADVISVGAALVETIEDCFPYLNSLVQNTPSSANIKRYADTVVDRAIKRSLVSLGSEIQEMASTAHEEAATLVDRVAARVDAISEKKTHSAPIRLSESLLAYADLLTDRMEGRIKPISTGFADLDKRLDGGLERGTLTVAAGRPGTGKTAFGLSMCRNVAVWGAAGFLSMEMDIRQVNDRNIAALGKLPVSWLRNPPPEDSDGWARLTHAMQRAQELEFYIDDQTGLNMLEIRNKARQIKRRRGLDLLVIDQLSFITGGSSKEKKTYELIGEYTRGLIAIAKQLNCAVLLLCQLNRECENRTNKRPQLSDLAMSGSIEQDAANVLFLYRDEIYNPDSQDRGICEVNCAKQRQGSPGVVPLTYVADQTRFEDHTHHWQPPKARETSKSKGFD
ncbi:MAG TPA: replicative DNA helicase [Noviherbaspirillum sp.]|nr:replicative DNA helicase [Noviherbaspirillum sp.]